MSLKLDNLGNGEQITKLFPKCRPRDVNLNPVPDNHHASAPPPPPTTLTLSSLVMDSDHQPDRSECEGEESCSQEETSMEESNEEEEEDDNSHLPPPDNKVVLQLSSGNKPATYKLRDSRIIEIAGGREVFCQSRSKALRKSRSEDKMNSTARRVKSPDRPGGIWELRSRASEGKKNHGSHEVTETVFSSEVHSVKHARTPSNKVSGGGSVVFDDIEDNWNGRGRGRGRSNVPSGGGISSGGSTPSPPGGNYHCSVPPAHFFKVSNSVSDGESISPERERADNKVARVIGGLPIAEYEGSPRRYGPRPQENPVLPSAHSLLASPSVYMPRPGFPQRVVSDDGDGPTDEHSPSHSLMNETRTTFDYLYEFSETRKVLEDFFKPSDNKQNSQQFQELDYELRRQGGGDNAYVGLRLAKASPQEENPSDPVRKTSSNEDPTTIDLLNLQEGCEEIETEVSGVGGGGGGGGLSGGQSRNFTLSPETTDCDSNCDSEASSLLAAVEPSPAPARAALGANPTMPVLEDGLSSGHTSDTDNNNPTVLLMKRQITEIEREIVERSNRHNAAVVKLVNGQNGKASSGDEATHQPKNTFSAIIDPADIDLESLDPLSGVCERTPPPPPAPAPHRRMSADTPPPAPSVEAALKDIRLTLQRTKTLPLRSPPSETPPLQLNTSPIWIPRRRGQTGTSGPSGDEEEADTDLETDRLLGQQRTDDHGFYEEKVGWRKAKTRGSAGVVATPINNNNNNSSNSNGTGKPSPTQSVSSGGANEGNGAPPATSPLSPTMPPHTPPSPGASPHSNDNGNGKAKKDKESSKKKGRNREVMIHEPAVLIEGVLFRARYLGSTQLVCEGQPTKSTRMLQAEEAVSRIKVGVNEHHAGCELAHAQEPAAAAASDSSPTDVSDAELGAGRLGPGSLFRLRFLGSVAVDEEEEHTLSTKRRMKKAMVEEAVLKIKAPEGETQPSTEVDLFISTEKIMVLNTDLKEIMMDHALRTISYIADIGDLVVLMARRRFVPHDVDDPPKVNRTPKMICHVFESEEAQFIAQSIGQAFQVAYMEFLKANGIEDHSFVKEMDYQEVLNSQEIFGDELQMFAKKEMQKEVVVPKTKGEILGVVIVESGWGSMLPTVVIANLAPAGAAARCGQLNIGDQIIAINGVSLVGLPLSTCQNYIKNSKTQTVVKLTVVPCAPVVEVKIKRPDTKYQLGFSVQNGVICSLLRGGIAERGGVRVGHRIIEINNQSVVAVPHEKIVNLLATSVGEILMKTMPTSMFRLLTGQETPVYI
ncbi:hypothetical protein LSTR_LSTR000182 [Laodelphax striatellus]|uniref:Protein lin-10 n=2 Tax=Auchenorrhyncha TaxID=1955247 RepID=A0A482X7N1_LAOST|nr:hypothetical protein LSTR_LSTR000182 [Laodelphax striatellus]